MHSTNAINRLYDEPYCATYEALYVKPWSRKHCINLHVIGSLLAALDECGTWLDTCCGPAWHFSRTETAFKKIGLDCSAAQIRRAGEQNPDSSFLLADLRHLPIRDGSVDILTNFWAAYCYLACRSVIADVFERCCRAVRLGGALYWEILTVDALDSFNGSDFAKNRAFRVQGIEGLNWSYVDAAGTHEMVSPPLSDFLFIARRWFRSVRSFHDGRFMHHLVCIDRRRVANFSALQPEEV